MFLTLKSMLLFCLLQCGSDSFHNFLEFAQNITKLRVIANSLVCTTNPRMNILNVKLYIAKTNVFIDVYICLLAYY